MPKPNPTFLRRFAVALLLCFVPTAASAVEHEVRILMDLDDDAGTGCLVNTVDGPFDGVEQILISTVQTSSSPDAGTVIDVATSDCTDEALDTFGAPVSFDGGWPVGVGGGVGGRDVVETYFPLISSVVADPQIVRLGVVVTDEFGGEEALLTADGEPIVLVLQDPFSVPEIPTLGEWGLILLALLLAAASLRLLGRRGTVAFAVVLLVLAAGTAWAAVNLDGLIGEWSAGDQLGANGIVLFGMESGGSVCFRVDVDLLFNQPPTITDVADQTIPEDSATGALAFTVGDPESAATDLTVTATSSNQVLVPDANLALGGSGANRTITVTPEPDQNGVTQITLTVEDPDGGTASTTFQVTVTSDNDPPTISAIADQSIPEDDTTGPLAFTVDDVETAPGSLTLMGSSSNTTIIPNGNIVFGGSGSNRTVTVTPAADQNGGPVTITVTVMDGDGGSVPEQFTVEVTAVNDAPSFTAGPDQTVDEDSGPQSVPGWATAISPGPADEAGQTLTFDVTNNTDPALFSAGPAISASGELTYTPADDANGSADVTIELMDNGGTLNGGVDTSPTQTFTINVTAVNDAPAVTASTISYTAVGNTLLRVDGADADDHDGGLPGRIASTTDLTDAFTKAGPSDVDSATVGFQAGTYATTGGGSLTIDDDGDFHYLPAAGFTGVDSVMVDVVDGDGGATPVTIEITVSGMVWYVEDTTDAIKNPAAGSDGRSTNAFETLAAAEAASGTGHIILVFETDAPLDEGITLKSGQKLYGQRVEEEPVSLLPDGLLLEAIADTNARPEIHRTSGGPAVLVDATAATLADPVEIRHLDLESGDDDAVRVVTGGTNTATVLIDENVVGGANQQGIDVEAGHTSGTAVVQIVDNAVSSTGHAIEVSKTDGGDLEVAIDGNLGVVSSAGHGIVLDGSAGGGTLTVTSFAGNTVHQDTAGTGVFVNTATFEATAGGNFETVAAGTLAVGTAGDGVGGSGVVLENVSGDLQFTDLDVRADNGAALLVTGTGELAAASGFRIASAAGSTLIANGGPAFDIDPATVGLTFDTISSAGSATNGVRLVDVGGTVTASGGSITGSTGDAFHVASTLATALNVTYGGTIANNSGRLIHVNGHPAGTIAFSGTSLTDSGTAGDTGTGILLNDLDGVFTLLAGSTTITDSDGTGFAVTGDSDGAITATNVTVTNPAMTAVHLVGAGMAATIDLDDFDVSQGTNGARMVDVQGLNDGSVDFDSQSALVATDGTGIRVSGNAAGTNPVHFNGPVDLGTGAGTRLSDGDAFTMSGNGAGTTVRFASLDVFTQNRRGLVATGAGVLDTVADAGPVHVDTTGSAAAAVDLDGIVSKNRIDGVTCSNDSNCVDLTSLGATSTTSFGNADLTCTGGTCFHGNAARTVEVTGAGNTISATGAVGLNLTNTTIGAADVTWQSISASGAANGIVLDTTGATGDFVVTGDGGTCTLATPTCTGGRIQGTTGADGAVAGNGVYLGDTGPVSLSFLRIDNHQNHAVFGDTVRGFSLIDSVINGSNGNNDAVDEGSIRFEDLLVEGALTRVDVSGGHEDNLRIVNETGTLNRLMISGSAFHDNSSLVGNDGILLESRNSAVMNVTVDNSAFSAHRGDHFDANATGSSAMDVVFTNNTMSGGHPNALGQTFILSNGASADVTFNVSDNTIEDAILSAFTFFQSSATTATSSLVGTFHGNAIGVTGDNGSGSAQGHGAVVNATGDGTVTVLVDANEVRQWSNEHGILVQAGDGSPMVNVTVTNNTIKEPNTTSFPTNGLHLNAGTTAAGTATVCLDVKSNDMTNSGAFGADDFRLRQRNNSTVNLPGYGGGSGDTAAVVTFVQGNNTGTPTGSASVSGSGGGFTGTGTSCTTP